MEVDFWANGSYPTDATIALVGRLENPGTSSTHYYLDFSHGAYDSPGITVDSWVNGERSNTVYSEPSDYYWDFNTVHTFRYAIFGSIHKFWWNKDVSQPADVIATDSLHTTAGRIGLVPAQVRGWWDNLKIRKYMEPEPSTSLGDEETASEYTADWYCSFTGVSLTNVVKFTLTFEGQYSNASVTQRLFLYSFTGSAWVLFDTFTTSSTPSIDETRTFDLAGNFSKYVSSGEVRFRVQAIKSTNTQFQCKADHANLMMTRAYDYVLKVSNQVGYAWSIFLARSSDSNIARLSNVTIWLHNGGDASKQIQIIGGSYTKTSGSPYSLAAGGADYIAISAIVSAAGTSQIIAYLKAEIPDSGVHVQLQITFQIT
jgi:hypothetical protein